MFADTAQLQASEAGSVGWTRPLRQEWQAAWLARADWGTSAPTSQGLHPDLCPLTLNPNTVVSLYNDCVCSQENRPYDWLVLTQEYYCSQNAVIVSQFLCPYIKIVLRKSILTSKSYCMLFLLRRNDSMTCAPFAIHWCLILQTDIKVCSLMCVHWQSIWTYILHVLTDIVISRHVDWMTPICSHQTICVWLTHLRILVYSLIHASDGLCHQWVSGSANQPWLVLTIVT